MTVSLFMLCCVHVSVLQTVGSYSTDTFMSHSYHTEYTRHVNVFPCMCVPSVYTNQLEGNENSMVFVHTCIVQCVCLGKTKSV